MKLGEILKPLKENIEAITDVFGDEEIGCDFAVIEVDGMYFSVDLKRSYWDIDEIGLLVLKTNQ